MTDPFERRVTELLDRLADHAPTELSTPAVSAPLATSVRPTGARGFLVAGLAVAAVVTGAVVWAARDDGATDVSTTDTTETVVGNPTVPASSTAVSTVADNGVFCALALDLVATAMPESYIGSADHLADIESMQQVAPAELAPEFAAYATFIASGAVDPADPESNVTENWPPGVQQAISEITTFISANCAGTGAFLGEPIGVDDQGDAVAALQQRLTDLGFDPGPVDGFFGQATTQALWAYQKLVLDVPFEQVASELDVELWEQMQQDVPIEPRRPGPGVHVELDLIRQVLAVFDGETPVVITHMSSGDGQPWTEPMPPDLNGSATSEPPSSSATLSGIGVTPGGVYVVEEEFDQGDGWVTGTRGRMYRPIYFDDGFAIYGAADVPNRPSSRGGVEVPMHVIERLGDLVDVGDAVYVFDGVQDPEFYGGGGPPPFEDAATG